MRERDRKYHLEMMLQELNRLRPNAGYETRVFLSLDLEEEEIIRKFLEDELGH